MPVRAGADLGGIRQQTVSLRDKKGRKSPSKPLCMADTGTNMAERLNITLIQSELAWENKAANLVNFGNRIAALAPGAELVVLPEMFSTGFSMRAAELAETMDGPTVKWMKATAASKRIILTG
ncbi:MAG: hypothetical protein EOO09_17935, partial [Chitinophagaceae bacterium]